MTMKQLSISMDHRETTLGWCYLFLQFLVLPSFLQTCNALLPVRLPDAILDGIFFAINFLCTAVIFRRFLLRSFQVVLRAPFFVLRFACILLAAYFVATYMCSLLTYWLRPDFLNLNDQSIAQMTGEHYVIMSIGTVILVPLAEETLFRGLIFGGLYNKNPIAAYAVSTLAFAAIHVLPYLAVYDPGLLALSLLQYIPAGILLGLGYAATDTIWTSIFMHIAINQIGIMRLPI